MTRMIGDEYKQKMQEILSGVPELFRSFVESHAYIPIMSRMWMG